MNAILEFLNGKKTNIGAIAGSAAGALQGLADALDINDPWYAKAIKVLLYISGGFGIPGLAHKLAKSHKKT
jgi:hypothetical protein